MSSVDAMEAACTKWLKDRRGRLRLQRTLYLVPGLDDESAGCWCGRTGTVADPSGWGAQVFQNWHMVTTDARGTEEWARATVRVVKFPDPYPSNPPGPAFDSFMDFGAYLREVIYGDYPDRGSPMGEYDLVCHSMGGLDAFAALLDLDGTVPPPAIQIANAYNYVAMDTPFRGVPNMPVRRKWSPPRAQSQCDALTFGSALLRSLEAHIPHLEGRVTRITCYGVDTATQIEVDSADLYNDRARYATAVRDADYRFIQIPGASHSGGMGITTSVITIANLFDTLTRSDRVSDLR